MPLRSRFDLDRLIHEPARLVILTALTACESADFVFLQRIAGLTTGNLSAHLTKLSEAGLVTLEKRFVGNKPNTQVALSPAGRRAIGEHWRRLELIKAEASGLKPARSAQDSGR
jgi:DNA-binding transcriptional ArsR family regulator